MSPLRFIFSSLSKPRNHHHHRLHRTFSDYSSTTIKCVRDRGLDHAVEKEKNLKPIINIKNFIKAEPSKSLPISIIAQKRNFLDIPTRPIEFIRKYPSVFEEFLSSGIAIHPHIRLTAQVLDLDAEEQLMYQSDSYKQQVADRLLKLLMLCRTNKLPLDVINRLKWDLGLPQDYLQSIVPEFPDYFRVVGKKDSIFGSEDAQVLELVCWSSDLATSFLEKKATIRDLGCTKEMPIAFPMQFSRGFEMDENWKKWVDDWQKLPYVSPYENAAHLTAKSDESDKWAVAVLHEFLHILVPNKTEEENVLFFGEYLGLRSRFKRAIRHHPGIFYLSSKLGTYTVVLRDGYKRGSLIENHPLMDLRSQYIHLMYTEKEDNEKTSGSSQKKTSSDSRKKGEEDKSVEENAGEFCNSSDNEVEDDEKSEYNNRAVIGKDAGKNRGRTRKTNFDKKGHGKFDREGNGKIAERRRLAGKSDSKTRGKQTSSDSRKKGGEGKSVKENAGEFYNSSDDEVEYDEKSAGDNQTVIGNDAAKNRSRTRKTNFDKKGHGKFDRDGHGKFDRDGHGKFDERRRLAGKSDSKTRGKFSSKISLRTEKHDGRNAGTNSKEKPSTGRSRRRPTSDQTSI